MIRRCERRLRPQRTDATHGRGRRRCLLVHRSDCCYIRRERSAALGKVFGAIMQERHDVGFLGKGSGGNGAIARATVCVRRLPAGRGSVFLRAIEPEVRVARTPASMCAIEERHSRIADSVALPFRHGILDANELQDGGKRARESVCKDVQPRQE